MVLPVLPLVRATGLYNPPISFLSIMQLTGIHHIALNVRDLDRAERFYTNVLGFKVAQRFSKGLAKGCQKLCFCSVYMTAWVGEYLGVGDARSILRVNECPGVVGHVRIARR